MDPLSRTTALDRHALVMAIWLAFGLVAATLFSYGAGLGGWPFILAAFAALFAAFVGHVIVNAVYRTTFTARELGLGLVLYAAALLGFVIAALFSVPFVEKEFASISLGFLALSAVVVFYMITHFGVRRAFDAFDVIRDFRARGAMAAREERSSLR